MAPFYRQGSTAWVQPSQGYRTSTRRKFNCCQQQFNFYIGAVTQSILMNFQCELAEFKFKVFKSIITEITAKVYYAPFYNNYSALQQLLRCALNLPHFVVFNVNVFCRKRVSCKGLMIVPFCNKAVSHFVTTFCRNL